MQFSVNKALVYFFILFIIAYFPLFYRLDAKVMRTWDESRTATSSIEMVQNNNYLVRYFDGHPDMWDVKPPFMQWVQVLFIKVLGINELAVRLPSAIFTLLLCFILVVYSKKLFLSFIPGFIASLVLITSNGYIGWHVARTADHDALLVFLITIGTFSYIHYLLFHSNRSLLLTFIVLAMAYLTKSTAAFFIIPSLFVLTIWCNKLLSTLKNKNFYIGIGLLFGPVLLYYFFRELQNPGYIKAVWLGEYFPIYFNTEKELTYNSFWFYVLNIVDGSFKYWWPVFLFSVGAGLLLQPKRKDVYVLLLIHLMITFVIISSGSKQQKWYDAPFYPIMAMIIGIAFYRLGYRLKERIGKRYLYLITFTLALLYLIFPYRFIVKKSVNISEDYWDIGLYAPSYYLRAQPKILENIDTVTVVSDIHAQQYYFYKHIVNQEYPNLTIEIRKKYVPKNKDYILFGEKSVEERIDSLYEYDVLDEYKNAKLLCIGEDKDK